MKYASVCSGVEAASLAWSAMGWEPVWFSEIEKFPCEVLEYRFPDVPNLGDMTKIGMEEREDGQMYHGEGSDGVFVPGGIDLLVGGTPCQGFSVAGKQGGLGDERSGLAMRYVEMLGAFRPKWFVWENVPGVFSTNGGNDIREFLGAIAEIGYSVSWRVLDAQYVRVDGYPRAVPQRRRRVIAVGHLGADWRYPAKALFDAEGVHRTTPPLRGNREGSSGGAGRRPEEAGGTVIGLNDQGGRSISPFEGVVPTIRAEAHQHLPLIAAPLDLRNATRDPDKMDIGLNRQGTGIGSAGEPSGSLSCGPVPGVIQCEGASVIRMRAGKPGGGKGALVSRELSLTLATENDQTLVQSGAYCIGNGQANESAAMEKEVCRTLHCLHEPMAVLCYRGRPWDPSSQDARGLDLYNQEVTGDVASTVSANSCMTGTRNGPSALQTAYAIAENIIGRQDRNGGHHMGVGEDIAYTQDTAGVMGVCYQSAVRRLTPLECERLMGFPDRWTMIPVKRHPAKPSGKRFAEFPDLFLGLPDGSWLEYAPDGPRYKACGNSMCVNVMRWVGRRIEKVESEGVEDYGEESHDD